MSDTKTAVLKDRELDYWIAENLMGWRWWAYWWDVRPSGGGPREKVRVRSLREPKFPGPQWLAWGERPDNDLRPATGEEREHPIDGYGDAIRVPMVPCYRREPSDIAAVLKVVEGWTDDRKAAFDRHLAKLLGCVRDPSAVRVLMAFVRKPHAVATAAYLAVTSEAAS